MKIREALKQELARREYAEYCIYVHSGKWILGKHLKLICEAVEDLIYDRTDKQILILTLPPQHGKSQCVTETLPSFYLGKFPEKRIIEVSYGDDLAQRFGRRNKDKIKEYGLDLFNIELSKERNSATDFEIETHKGSMISRGIMSGITGQPGDLIIIDDPVKSRQEADSETYRERVWMEFTDSIYSRLSAKGKIIVIQTRWHEDDLAGRLLNSKYGFSDKVRLINIPCEAEENDILGRNIGDALFPEIGKDNNWLKSFKKGYMTESGTRSWNALYQGRPTAQEGNMLKRAWWKWYRELPQIMVKIISVDATFKDNEKNDFVSIQAWGKSQANMFLIDKVKARMDFPTTLQAIKNMKAKHKDARGIYIEDKANGSAIISVLRQSVGGIIAVQPYGSKEARVSAISPQIEAGNVWLPDGTEWIGDFVEECSAFPTGAHDDDVDAMSQAILKLKDMAANLPVPQPHHNFNFEKPKPNAFDGLVATDSWINY